MSKKKKLKTKTPFVLPETGMISIKNLSIYLGIDAELLLCSLPDSINIITIDNAGIDVSIIQLDEFKKPEFKTSIKIIREGIIKSRTMESLEEQEADGYIEINNEVDGSKEASKTAENAEPNESETKETPKEPSRKKKQKA